MDKVQMIINFCNDIANAFGSRILVVPTSTVHFVIALTELKQLIITLIDHQLQNHFDSYLKKSKKDIVLSLHKEIAHPIPKND